MPPFNVFYQLRRELSTWQGSHALLSRPLARAALDVLVKILGEIRVFLWERVLADSGTPAASQICAIVRQMVKDARDDRHSLYSVRTVCFFLPSLGPRKETDTVPSRT